MWLLPHRCGGFFNQTVWKGVCDVSQIWPKEASATGNGLESTFLNIYVFYILNIYIYICEKCVYINIVSAILLNKYLYI